MLRKSREGARAGKKQMPASDTASVEKTVSAPVLELAAFLPFRLSVLSNTISEKIAATYRGAYGLTVPQWRVMAILKQRPRISATAVSDATAMDKVAVSRAVAKLIEQGRVERLASQEDGRSSALVLTTAGEALYAVIAPTALAFEQDLLGALSASEREQLGRLLQKMADRVSPDQPLW